MNREGTETVKTQQREIKFRAWDLANERMVDEPYKFYPITTGRYEKDYGATYIFYESWQDIDDGIDRPCHIMQFTGLVDKHGKEIYENDILSTEYKAVVKFLDGSWMVVFNGPHERTMLLHEYLTSRKRAKTEDRDCEVIGNIYSSPDLIKE